MLFFFWAFAWPHYLGNVFVYMGVCVWACEEGCLPFNVVCKKNELQAHAIHCIHMHVCVCVCKWVGPFTHTHETKFVLWPQRCHSQLCSRQKKGAACCCNCSKKTGNAPTQTAMGVCMYVCRNTHLHMYCTYVRAYVRHMQFKCPYWFPELNICKMIIHCAASVASVCYHTTKRLQKNNKNCYLCSKSDTQYKHSHIRVQTYVHIRVPHEYIVL